MPSTKRTRGDASDGRVSGLVLSVSLSVSLSLSHSLSLSQSLTLLHRLTFLPLFDYPCTCGLGYKTILFEAPGGHDSIFQNTLGTDGFCF